MPFPIPGIPGNIVLQFPSRKSRMEFFTLIPVPENGNGILITVPVPENWIGIFHLESRSRKMGMEFAISRSRSRSPKVIPAHGWRNVMSATLDPALTALKVMTGEGRV